MKYSYYLRNNPVIVMGIIKTALQQVGQVDMGRITVLLPILLDERMVEKLLDSNRQYTFRQLVMQNNMYLANYNDRYLSLLTPFYRALSIMMDADAVKLNGADIEPSDHESFSFVNSCYSGRMEKVTAATCRLWILAEKESNKDLYQLLKVAL